LGTRLEMVLRSISALSQGRETFVAIIGSGPQEDEIRYLMSILMPAMHRVIKVDENEQVIKEQWLKWADILLEIPDEAEAWKIRKGSQACEIPFSEYERLDSTIRSWIL